MDSIERAHSAFAQLEHAVAEHRANDTADDRSLSLGLLTWQIGAGIVGLAETLISASLTWSVPNAFVIWALPFVSGMLLLLSVFTRHRRLPGILGALGTGVCAAAVALLAMLVQH